MRHYAGGDHPESPVYLEIDPVAPLGLRRETGVDSQHFADGGRGAWKGTVGELLAAHGMHASDDVIECLTYNDLVALTADPHVAIVLD